MLFVMDLLEKWEKVEKAVKEFRTAA